MSSRNEKDVFTDDSDESCPLCVEEFDLSDKNFRPCPCGYQVCQFCYNNIKNNMNGLCPACRRPYDEQSIEWRIVSPEEQKADVELQARKKAAARKKESERKQVETNNRKNLAGLRVVQKNLVYVVGLTQKSSEDDFLQTLRGDQYFGQYGRIIKIVVSKAKEGSHNNNTVGVYVTFERKEDAAKCIAAVDGSRNLDRPLRAQYGTTKYCSAYLRNEQCQNRNCTFLHEVGEDYDSFSRQDLSSMNAMSTQRPAQASSASSKQTPLQPQPPPQAASQNIAGAAAPPHPQHVLRDEGMSRSDSGDGSALPSSASWAARNAAAEHSKSSKPAGASLPSPTVPDVQPDQPSQLAESRQSHTSSPAQAQHMPSHESHAPMSGLVQSQPHPLERAIKSLMNSSLVYNFDRSVWSEEDLKVIDNYPPLFAPNGGSLRLRLEKEQEQERLKQEQERNALGAIAAAEEDENPASGSFQLGGEPETQGESVDSARGMTSQQRSTMQPPYNAASNAFAFGGSSLQNSSGSSLARTLTPQQQHQLSLLRTSASERQSPVSHGQFHQSYGQNTNSLHQHQPSNPFQLQMQNLGFGSAQGHTRQASRFTFANDSATASTAVKPAANPHLMAQQSAMMPPSQSKQYQQTNNPNGHFYSGVQGPPPGLKSSGTPPISGGGMFGQGHGFASAMGGSTGYASSSSNNKNDNDTLMRELLRNRNGSLNGQGADSNKQSELTVRLNPRSSKDDSPQKEHPSSVLELSSAGVRRDQPEIQSIPTATPPGLSSAQDFPPLAAPTLPAPVAPKLQRKTTAQPATPAIKPVVPVVHTATVVKTEASKMQPLDDYAAPRTQHVRPDAAANASISTQVNTSTNIPEARSQAKGKGKGKVVSSDNKTSIHGPKIEKKPIAPKAADHRPQLANLDLAAAKGATKEEATVGNEKSNDLTTKRPKTDVPSSAAGSSQPSTPTTAFSQPSAPTSVRPSHAKTIRLTTGSPSMTIGTDSKQTSRRPSLNSINRPDTPNDERAISDNASFTTNSLSRANSPPPNKIGSAPVRQVTKSQQKKERQTRAKQAEETSKKDDPSVKEENVVQAPIVGRKKKTKKAKEPSQATATSTPAVTRPSSPEVRETIHEEHIDPSPAKSVKGTKKSNKPSQSQQSASETISPTPPTPADATSEEPRSKMETLFNDYRALGAISADAEQVFFSQIAGTNGRADHALEVNTVVAPSPPLSIEQIAILDSGKPVAVTIDKNNAVLVYPDRRCLRGLTPERAERAVALHSSLGCGPELPVFASFGQGPLPMERDITDRLIVPYQTWGAQPPPYPGKANDAAMAGSSETTLYNRFAEPIQQISSRNQIQTAPALKPRLMLDSQASTDRQFRSSQAQRGSPRDDGPNTTSSGLVGELPTWTQPAMGVAEAEMMLAAERKNVEAMTRYYNTLVRKNKRLAMGNIVQPGSIRL